MKKVAAVIILTATLLISNCTKAQNPPQARAEDAKSEKKSEKAASGPAIKVPETDINLGTIPREKLEVVGEIAFFNTGDKPLEVLKVSGACDCYSGHSGDEIVQPGASGVLQARFDKNKIPAGHVMRSVDIETNDPVNNKVEVRFNFTVERDPMEEQLRLVSYDVTKLRQEVAAVHRDLAKALALIEGGLKPQAMPEMVPDTNVYDVNIGSSPFLGPKDAPVTIVGFTDFQCPFCGREYPKIKQVMEMYKDKVKFVFKHFPLPFHTQAKAAHAAAQLALEQKGPEVFWKMHDRIIAEPNKIDVDDLRGYASDLDMVLDVFDEVMADENKMNQLLSTDMAEAMKCNVNATPTVLINGLKMQNRDISDYQKRIDQILAEQKS